MPGTNFMVLSKNMDVACTLCCLFVTMRLLIGMWWTFLPCWSIWTVFFPFLPSRLQLGWCFFNFSSCDFFLSKGYLLPCLKCNNDSHRGFYLDGLFSRKTFVAINRTMFFPKVPRWLVGPCAQISSEE